MPSLVSGRTHQLENATPGQQTTDEQRADDISTTSYLTLDGNSTKGQLRPHGGAALSGTTRFCLRVVFTSRKHSITRDACINQVKSWQSLSGRTLNDLLDAVEMHKPSRLAAETPGNAKRFLVIFAACTLALLLCGNVEIPRPAKWIAFRLLGAGDRSEVSDAALSPNHP